MSKRLIVVFVAVLMILSLTACMPNRKADNKQSKSSSNEPLKQETGTTSSAGSNIKNNTGESDSDSLIDDLSKSIADMGGIFGSLDDAADEDLYVPPPQ